ncbi:hypothetical protein pdam_00005571 [Pocillopora damicornis]|uniref:Uncharacterized protein n=1 Tax=Pocillopora damicornis TaxID=46731 RepID=A0A3M6TK10_POCDA|nr:hypothetical protein pdam_00005571 [Pocillopora damicornis]
MAAKRPIVEQGDTPGKPENKRQSTEGRSRKSLLQEGNIPIKSSGRRGCDKWPMQSDPKFWDSCANVVKKTCNSSRTGRGGYLGIVAAPSPRLRFFSGIQDLSSVTKP